MKFHLLTDQSEQNIVKDDPLLQLGEETAYLERRPVPEDALSLLPTDDAPAVEVADGNFAIQSVSEAGEQPPGKDPLTGNGNGNGNSQSVNWDNDGLLTAGRSTASPDTPGDWIIIMDSQSPELPEQAAARGAQAVGGQTGFVYDSALKGFVIKNATEERIQRLIASNPNFLFAERDQDVNLTSPPNQGLQQNSVADIGNFSTEVTPWGINRVGGFGNGIGKTAWVIDSGIDLDHPDLNVDSSRGFSAFAYSGEATPDDGNGHGTHVAGTIAAIDNEFGVVGVAAGATVVPVKVLNKRGGGRLSGVIAGIDHVAANANPGDAANLSLGGGISRSLDLAVTNLGLSGVNVVMAAGNSADNVEYYSPARVDGSSLYTISAMNSNDYFAYFSNYGVGIDFAAPGVDIQSTWKDGGYNTISGTSMAAPHVAGILLLGDVNSDGTVMGDPDGIPDPIAYR